MQAGLVEGAEKMDALGQLFLDRLHRRRVGMAQYQSPGAEHVIDMPVAFQVLDPGALSAADDEPFGLRYHVGAQSAAGDIEIVTN